MICTASKTAGSMSPPGFSALGGVAHKFGGTAYPEADIPETNEKKRCHQESFHWKCV